MSAPASSSSYPAAAAAASEPRKPTTSCSRRASAAVRPTTGCLLLLAARPLRSRRGLRRGLVHCCACLPLLAIYLDGDGDDPRRATSAQTRSLADGRTLRSPESASQSVGRRIYVRNSHASRNATHGRTDERRRHETRKLLAQVSD